MEKVYELTVLFHPDLEIDLDTPLKKLNQMIADNGGSVVAQDNWGKKKLAYQIKKQDFAVYVYSEVSMPAQHASKLQGLLNITDEVVRYLMVEKDLKAPEVAEATDESENKEG